MANPHRGDVTVSVGDDEYTFSFSINALCELEDRLGKPVSHIVKALGDPDNIRITDVRALVWAAMLDHQEDITLKEAGKVASDVGFKTCLLQVGAALEIAFPPEKSGKKNPRRAKS